MIQKALLPASFILILFFSSCDKNMVFEQNIEIPDNAWDVNNVLKFDAAINDTNSAYNFYFNVRNASGYGYSNLYVFFTSKLPHGEMSRDTVELRLADASGKWLGEGSGDIWDNRILFKSKMKFPQAGTYHFEMQQAMRDNPLQMIMDAGIRIEKAQ